jgi:hypothetical protein
MLAACKQPIKGGEIMEASDQATTRQATSDDLFDVSVEVRVQCTGVPGPDAQATARQMVENALSNQASLEFTIVDVGEPDHRQDS